MDLIARCCCLLVLVSAAAFTDVQSAAIASRPSAGSPEVLRNIIIELENVLFRLKDYAREMQIAAIRKESQLVGSASDSKSEVDELQLAAGKALLSGEAAKSRPSGQQLDVEGGSDISLREALEYLVSLAKQKKIERRDHDIPFPLTDRDTK